MALGVQATAGHQGVHVDVQAQVLRPGVQHQGERAGGTQHAAAPEALFQAADSVAVAVALVIANRAPANAADLQALVIEQLQARYTIAPAAGGYGLYLVFWFGHRPRSTPEGLKPRSAQQMGELLVERIPAAERYRLAVQVLDLSLPAGSD